MTASHTTASLPNVVARLSSALSTHDLERVISLLGEDEFIPGGIILEYIAESGAEFGRVKRFKGHAEIREVLAASVCHKEASFEIVLGDEDDEENAVQQESLFSAFVAVKVRTPRTESLFPKGWTGTMTVDLREGTSRIRRIRIEPDDAVARVFLEEGKRIKERGEGNPDEMEI